MEIFNAQQKRTFSDSLVLRSQNFRVRLNLFIQNAVLVGLRRHDCMFVLYRYKKRIQNAMTARNGLIMGFIQEFFKYFDN